VYFIISMSSPIRVRRGTKKEFSRVSALLNGKIDEAIKQFKIVLKERPGDVEMHCNLGILLERQGKITGAIEQYREALQINPEYTKAAELLEAALEKQKKLQ